ncbi:Rpp14/Pop5 family-domain-containing protein, partial [Rhizoctonia solani]
AHIKKKESLVTFRISSCGGPTPNLSSKQIYNAIRDSVIENFGDSGWGAVAVKYFSPTTQICIVRVARDHHITVWGGITLLRTLSGIPMIPHVIHCTLKKAQLATITHNRTVIARRRANEAAHTSDAYDAYLAKSTKEIEALKD